jgi:hypothetical protein
MYSRADIRFQIDQGLMMRLAKVYGGFAQYTRQLIEDLIKEEGALTCREAIRFSPPLDGKNGGRGDQKIAETWGNWAVALDVLSFVNSDDKRLSSAVSSRDRRKFQKWRQGKSPTTQGIIRKIWEDNNTERAFQKAVNLFGGRSFYGSNSSAVLTSEDQIKSAHDKLRSLYRGRIRKNNGPPTFVRQHPYLADQKLIESYIKKRQTKVGWMKAGWFTCIKKIGPPVINGVPKNFGINKLPKWILRHNAFHGSVSLNIRRTPSPTGRGVGDSYTMSVVNNLGNIFGVGYLAGTKRYVIAVREGKVTKRLRHFIRAAINKANKGQVPS